MLDDRELLEAWAEGLGRDAAARARLLVERAAPEDDRRGWTVGRRDAVLVELHRVRFGERIEGVARCPSCGERVEAALPAAALAGGSSDASSPEPIDCDGWRVVFRLPDDGDLEAAAAVADPAAARRALAERCVVRAERGGTEQPASAVPEAVLARMAESMAEREPGAAPELELSCPACQRTWSEPFDLVDFVAAEMESEGLRIAGEVHALAGAYGWSEAEILALSPARRAAYLELALG